VRQIKPKGELPPENAPKTALLLKGIEKEIALKNEKGVNPNPGLFKLTQRQILWGSF